MVKLTRSLKRWLSINYDRYDRETLALIQFGHTELMTKEMWDEYIKWLQTEEGQQYLKGRRKYREDENV